MFASPFTRIGALLNSSPSVWTLLQVLVFWVPEDHFHSSISQFTWMDGGYPSTSLTWDVCLDWDLLVPYFMGTSPRLKLPSASVGANGCPELVPSLDSEFQEWPSPVGPGHPTWVNLKIGHLNLELISGTCLSPGIAKWGSSSQHEAWWRALMAPLPTAKGKNRTYLFPVFFGFLQAFLPWLIKQKFNDEKLLEC